MDSECEMDSQWMSQDRGCKHTSHEMLKDVIRAEAVAQVVEHLPTKCEALSSISIPPINK
jgi:hypothetical protein